MATERQIAANRRNAGKSTGPRKPWISCQPRRSPNRSKNSRAKLPANKDPVVLERARDAAYAEIDLARVRRVKVALINA
jgi:hypothetical protein